MRYKIFITIIFSFLIFHTALAVDTSNTGFIPGQIWYSVDPLVEGDTVKVYTAVWNGDANPLSANVEFYDKNVILGTRSISVSAESIQNISINWKVTAGDHVISAKILGPKISESGKSYPVVLARSTTGEDRIFVSKLISQVDGTPVSSTDALKNKLDETTANLSSVLPGSISRPVSGALSAVDVYRDSTLTNITVAKKDTQKQIDAFSAPSNQVKSTEPKGAKPAEKKALGGAEKPIAYVKLFFLTIAGFIFGSSFVFYLCIALIVFFIVRSIYRKIKGI